MNCDQVEAVCVEKLAPENDFTILDTLELEEITNILVKTSNRTIYIHEYNGIYGYEFQSLTASEPLHIIL